MMPPEYSNMPEVISTSMESQANNDDGEDKDDDDDDENKEYVADGVRENKKLVSHAMQIKSSQVEAETRQRHHIDVIHRSSSQENPKKVQAQERWR